MTLQAKLGSLAMAMALTLLVGSSAYAKGDKLSKGDKKWLEEEVAALITAGEIEIFKDLKSKDRKLFKEIFWARRDPDPMTPKNEFIDDYKERVKTADKNIKNVGRKGSRSDMGHIAILLGGPKENSRDDRTVTWRYDPDPSIGIPDGFTVQFRDLGMGLRIVDSKDVRATLERVKTFYLMNRGVTYTTDDDGRLLKPSAQFDPNSPAKKPAPRNDRDANREFRYSFRSEELFLQSRGRCDLCSGPSSKSNAEALTWKKDKASATIFGAVQNAEGQALAPFEQPVELENTDGVAKYEMPLQIAPGSYTFLFGVLDNESNTVGTRVLPVEVPDLYRDEVTLSSVLAFSDELAVESVAGTPGHGFQFGQTHFVPSRTYSTAGYIGLFFFVYGFAVDEETGKGESIRPIHFLQGWEEKRADRA